jgi:4-carboxymuconolactone decarboxylase
MRLNTPRISPLTQADWTEEQRAVLEPFTKQGRLYNIFTTLGHNPTALQAFLAWGGYVMRKTQLSARERELAILRVGYLCKAGYEWAQHSRLGKEAGLTDEELARIKIGPASNDWSVRERLLLQACDELHVDYFVSDATWRALLEHFDQRQCMDLVFVIGHYTQVCMMLNTFGIQLDDGLTPDADLSAPAD